MQQCKEPLKAVLLTSNRNQNFAGPQSMRQEQSVTGRQCAWQAASINWGCTTSEMNKPAMPAFDLILQGCEGGELAPVPEVC